MVGFIALGERLAGYYSPVIRDACDQQTSGGDIGKARLLFPD